MEAQQASDSRGYDSIVSMEADGLEISATVPGVHREVHVVSILGYRLDVVPGDHALIFTYADEPGQVGRMGTILGEEGINISTMAIGKRADCCEVLVFLNVESEPSSEVIERVAQAIDATNSWAIRL